ncbi:hypothetical protein Zmor_016523 [Zophobas morio]|uniref:Protein hunchback n=1 Tax=Zophobas morio TaxID=2755281 RepID=A0AA38MC01_9CUCU|nr:hypothetical protein Zmor_016523 [Zophobas morio]
MVTLQYAESVTAPKKPSLVNVHACKICPYVTTSFFLMINHVRRHQSPLESFNCENPLDSYHCKHCNFQTELTLLFKAHIKEHHGIKHENDDLIVQHNNQRYVCEKCEFETHFSLKWLRHRKECHPPNSKLQHFLVEDKIKWLHCAECTFKSKGKRGLRRHINARHVDDLVAKWYECKQCSFRSKYNQSLSRHVISCHLDKKDGKWYECQQCPYKTREYSKLRSHMIIQHSNGESITWYQCNECPFKTTFDRVLEMHVNARHSNRHFVRWYDCEKCQYKTKCRFKLNKHMNARHLDEDEIEWHHCSECPYKCKDKDGLKRHINARHLDDQDAKWYECKQCPFKTRDCSALKKHVNSQHLERFDIKWYDCEKCQFKTKYPQSLRIHINRWHLDKNEIKWYHCSECAFRSKNKGGLKSHINARHLSDHDAKWEKQVQKVFGTYLELTKHFEEEHHIQIEEEVIKCSNVEEFNKWMLIQRKSVRYTIRRKNNCSNSKTNRRIVYYDCNRSNNGYESKAVAKLPKVGGSIKIKGTCPSRIIANFEEDGTVTVKYIKSHIGHEEDLRCQSDIKNYGFLFKQQGDEAHAYLRKDDFAVGFMNSVMEHKLKVHKDIICIDGTHNTNNRGWELTTLLVKDDRGVGFPVAFLVSNRNWNIQGRSKIKNPEIRKSMKTDMGKILRETNENRFATLSEIYMKKLAEADEIEFLNYLKKNYFQSEERIKSWAYCFRINSEINTNMAIESLHKFIKYDELNKRRCNTIENLLDILDKVVEDKTWTRVVELHRPSSNSYQQRMVRESHRKAESIENNVEEVEFGEFLVKSVNSNLNYRVAYGDRLCKSDCKHMYCTICEICFHQYTCQCPQFSVKHITCKHVHMVALYERKKNECMLGRHNTPVVVAEDHNYCQSAKNEEINSFIEEQQEKSTSDGTMDDETFKKISQETIFNQIRGLGMEDYKDFVTQFQEWMKKIDMKNTSRKRKIDNKQTYYPMKKSKNSTAE